MARKMASREPSLIRKPSPEIVATAASGNDQDLKKKKTYKSTHSIGSRKATEKVVTYSETLQFFPEMVQQLLNDRSMEPKKASPGKTPPAKSSPARTSSAAKASPAKSPKPSSGKQTTPTKSSTTKSSSPKTPTAKSPSPKMDANSSSSPTPTGHLTQLSDGGQSPKCTNSTKNSSSEGSKSAVKRKNSNEVSLKESASSAKKPKMDPASKPGTTKAAKSGNNDSKISVAEKLKEISAKAENEEPKKKRGAAGTGSGASSSKKPPAAKPKNQPKSPAGKNKAPQPAKNPAKKAPKKKKEEAEIPSLSVFIKPKREASMNANAMMDILFEKPVSPRKKTVSKTPPNVSSNKAQEKDTIPKSAKKKLVFDKDSPKSASGKKTESKSKAAPKPKKSAANKPKSTNKRSKTTEKKTGVANGKVVKRKCKKRMASLNARALIVAERESLQSSSERAARTDRYCLGWPNKNGKPPNDNRSIRWVDGLVGCGVCCSKKDQAESTADGGGMTEVSAHPPTLPNSVPESKHPVPVLPSPPLTVVPHDKDHVSSDDRPSSVVDVVTAHTPHLLDSVSHQPSVVDVVSTHSPVKAQVLSSTLGSFGGLYGHSAPCMGPCPGYAYSTHTHTEGYVTTSSYQCFSGIGSVNAMPLVAPTFRPSAFSVPGFNLPYSYYEGGPPFYQPPPAPLLQGPLPTKTCMIPHHISFPVPHGQVRVLIHNPDTPHDQAAFSEHRPPGKGDPHHPTELEIMRKITNDNNNNSNGSLRNNSNLAKIADTLNHSSPPQAANHNNNNNGKRGSDKNGSDKSNCKVDNSRKTNESKKKDSDAKKSDKNGSKNTKNGEGNSKKKNDNGKKKEGGSVALKNKESKETKANNSSRPPKKKADKKKAGDKDVAEAEAESKEDETIPEHGWVWVGEPEIKKVVSMHMDQPPEERRCYKAIRHSTHGDIINVRDCVLLRSGCCRNDVPYVAKVGTFWEHPKTSEKMMSLLWYYQPEHTEAGRQSHDMENEVFASRHRDENSVACIDDKCHVLTYEQYCRYQAEMHRIDYNALPRPRTVPDLDWSKPDVDYPQKELPSKDVDPSTIFCCRNVYDFRMKRILKNPS